MAELRPNKGAFLPKKSKKPPGFDSFSHVKMMANGPVAAWRGFLAQKEVL
jgi:hypothetical protein